MYITRDLELLFSNYAAFRDDTSEYNYTLQLKLIAVPLVINTLSLPMMFGLFKFNKKLFRNARKSSVADRIRQQNWLD